MTAQEPTASPDPDRPRSRPPLPARTKLVLLVLLGVPIVGPLLVPLYAEESPDLGGMPFFFWAQFAMIPIASALTWTAFVVVSRREGHGGER